MLFQEVNVLCSLTFVIYNLLKRKIATIPVDNHKNRIAVQITYNT